MDVDHVGELVKSGVLAHEHRDLLDDVGSMGSIGVAAKNLPLRRGEKLEQAFCLIHSEGLAIGTPEGLAALVRRTSSLQLILCGAYAGGLRLGEDSSGHDVEVDAVALAQNMVDCTDSLHLSCMGKQLFSIGVANGIEVRGER